MNELIYKVLSNSNDILKYGKELKKVRGTCAKNSLVCGILALGMGGLTYLAYKMSEDINSLEHRVADLDEEIEDIRLKNNAREV